jgi:uncharacterized surface protein with fasciclin (FAS1) repeats
VKRTPIASLLLAGLVPVWACLASCGEEGQTAVNRGLPDYPRRTLFDLRDALGLWHDMEGSFDPTLPFVVTGTLSRGPDGALLTEDTLLCCAGITVGFYLDVDSDLQGSRVAVAGRVAPGGKPRLKFLPLTGRAQVVVEGTHILVDQIVPADSLIQQDNIVDRIGAEGLTVFARALRVTGVDEALRAADPITILAPIDAAFSDAEIASMFRSDAGEQLRQFVLRHVLRGRFREQELRDRVSVTAYTHDVFPVHVVNGRVRIGAARTVFEDIAGSNGVVHLIHAPLRAKHATERRLQK